MKNKSKKFNLIFGYKIIFSQVCYYKDLRNFIFNFKANGMYILLFLRLFYYSISIYKLDKIKRNIIEIMKDMDDVDKLYKM